MAQRGVRLQIVYQAAHSADAQLVRGLLATRSADYDGDGVPERQENYLRGVLHTVEWRDKQGCVIKRDTYTGGRLSGGEIDHDGDGAPDTARVYDGRGEIRHSEPLSAK